MIYDIAELDERAQRMRVTWNKANNFYSTFAGDFLEIATAIKSGRYGNDWTLAKWLFLKAGLMEGTVLGILRAHHKTLADAQREVVQAAADARQQQRHAARLAAAAQRRTEREAAQQAAALQRATRQTERRTAAETAAAAKLQKRQDAIKRKRAAARKRRRGKTKKQGKSQRLPPHPVVAKYGTRFDRDFTPEERASD